MVSLDEFNELLVATYGKYLSKKYPNVTKTEDIDLYEAVEELQYADKPVFKTDQGVIALEDAYGGEGQGDSYYIVYSLELKSGKKVFFKYNGFYSSWAGVDWHEVEDEEVIGEEKIITVWQTKKSVV